MSEATPVAAAPAAPIPAQQQTPPTPAPVVPPPAAPTEASPGAKEWTAIRAQEARLKAERDALKASAKEAEELRSFKADIARLARENPDEAAKLAGIDYNEWTRRKLTGGRKDPVAELRGEVERLKEQTAAEKAAAAKQAEESHAKALENHWQLVDREFSTMVKGSGEKHEFLRAELEGNADEVRATLREMGAARPDLTLDQAADLYEQHLADRFKRFASLAKARGLLTPPPEAAKHSNASPGNEQGNASDGHGARTLTNGLTQERSVSPAPPGSGAKSKLMQAAEEHEARLQRAMAKFAT